MFTISSKNFMKLLISIIMILQNICHRCRSCHRLSRVFKIHRISSLYFISWSDFHDISPRLYRLFSRKNFGNKIPFWIHDSEMIHDYFLYKNILGLPCLFLIVSYGLWTANWNELEMMMESGFMFLKIRGSISAIWLGRRYV